MAKQSIIERRGDVSSLGLETGTTLPQPILEMPGGQMKERAEREAQMPGSDMPGGSMNSNLTSGELTGTGMPGGAMTELEPGVQGAISQGDMPSGEMTNAVGGSLETGGEEMPSGDMTSGGMNSSGSVSGQSPAIEISGSWKLTLSPSSIKNVVTA